MPDPTGWSWKALDPKAKYPELNQKLKGLPEYIRSVKPAEEEDKTPAWLKALASFNQGIIEGVPFVKPALKKLDVIPESQKKLMEESAAEKPGFNIAGNIAGGIGATGAVPVLKAVAGAKALLPALGRGAVNAATYAVPSSVSQAVDTGDVGKAALGGLGQLAAGAVFGAVGEKSGELLQKGWKGLRNWLTDKVAAAGGLRSRKVMEVLQGSIFGRNGVTPQRAEALKNQIADAIQNEKLYGKQTIMQFLEDKGQIWNQVDAAWEKSGKKVSDFLDVVKNTPDVTEWLTSIAKDPDTGKLYRSYARATIKDIFTKAETKKDLPAIRELLLTTMKNGLKDGSNLGQIKADVAGSLRDVIDNAFIPPGMKEEYPALLALKKSLAYNEATITRTAAGSPTAPRTMVRDILGTAAQGGATTAGGAGAVATFDPNRPETWLPAAGLLTASTLGGAAVNRMLAKGQNQLTGRLAGAVRKILPEAIPGLAGNTAKIGAALGGAGGKLAPIVTQAFQQAQQPASEVDVATSQTEAAADPQTVATARQAVNTQYRDKVREALAKDWQENFAMLGAQFGITFEDFAGIVSQVTDGFDDPKKTARILFHDQKERDKFLSDYDAALKFQGMDIDPALQYADPGGVLGWLKGKPGEAQASYQNLIDYSGKVFGQGKEISEAERKRIEGRVRTIATMKGKTPDEKRAMVEAMLAEFGIDFSRLSELGLYGAKNG